MKVEVEIMLIQLGKNVALLWILRILAVPVVLVLFAAGFLLNLLYEVVGAFWGGVSPRRCCCYAGAAGWLLWGSSSFCRRCIPNQPDCAAAAAYVGGQSSDLRRVRAVHLPL